MTGLLRVAERVVEAIDWIAAVLLIGYAALAGVVGLMFGALSFLEKHTLGGHEATLAMAVAFGLPGLLAVLGGLGMHWRSPWRWWIQLAPYPAFMVLFSVAVCIGGSSVHIGNLVLCSR